MIVRGAVVRKASKLGNDTTSLLDKTLPVGHDGWVKLRVWIGACINHEPNRGPSGQMGVPMYGREDDPTNKQANPTVMAPMIVILGRMG